MFCLFFIAEYEYGANWWMTSCFWNHTTRLAGEQLLTLSKHSNTSEQANVVILMLKFFLREESQWTILEFDCNHVFIVLSDALMENEVWRSCQASVRVHHHQCVHWMCQCSFLLSEALAGLGLFTANHTCRNLTLNAADSVYRMFPFFFLAAFARHWFRPLLFPVVLTLNVNYGTGRGGRKTFQTPW